MKQKIGYIQKCFDGIDKFKFREATFTRTINSRGDKIRSEMLIFSVDYEDIVFTAKMMKDNPKVIIISEPFLLDDELREKCIKWVEWANEAEPWEYDLFTDKPNEVRA